MYTHLQKSVHENAIKAFKIGLMAGTSGNFSTFDRSLNVMAITPSSLDYDLMHIEDIVILDCDGKQLSGKYKPSSEWQMHLAIYLAMQNVLGIAHTHAPYATSFAVTNESIPVVLIEMVLLGGEVPVAPFALPGSLELGENVVTTLQQHKVSACLLENHGALSIGHDLNQALTHSIYLEDAAKIYHLAKSVGNAQVVDKKFIQAMKEKMGIQ